MGHRLGRDALVLIALVLLSVLPYAGEIGFYSDDWSFLSSFDVVTSILKVEDGGLSTVIYGYYVHYPYGERLFVYHPGGDQVHVMKDAKTARVYFERDHHDLSRGCPAGRPGYGVPIFR